MANEFIALGGGGEIGASCYFYKLGKTNLLIDAGSRFSVPAFPDFTHLSAHIGSLAHLDALLISHAHFDHIGALLRVQHDAPHVPKYATAPTHALIDLMLQDHIGIQARHQRDGGAGSHSDLLGELLDSIQIVAYNQTFSIAEDVQVTPLYAGHILGAAAFLIETPTQRILHTGDYSLQSQALLHGATGLLAVDNIDLLVTESTYLYQPDMASLSAAQERQSLLDSVDAVIQRGGRALIPAFSLGRAQEIAFTFKRAFLQGQIAPFPVLIDGMAHSVAEVYNTWRDYFQIPQSDAHLIYNEWVRAADEDSRRADLLPPCCIIASSGMLLDGTRSAHYAAHLMPYAQDAIFFSGYLDEESPGERLANLKTGDKFEVNGRSMAVHASVRRFKLSAHAQSRDIRRLIETIRPSQVVTIHGDHRYAPPADFIDFAMAQAATGTTINHATNGKSFYF
ncbi:MAG: MBL fold metallo-hydrolase [Chloroflexota bacterium]|nr:MBL fold metallo-hydrolase [Chloroflexota bacterium]